MNFNLNFLENENFFQKTGVPFLVETTEIENASFPFKTALSPITKSGILQVTVLFFWKICFSFRTS